MKLEMTEHAVQRKLLRKIVAEVTQHECVDAMLEYIYCKLPKYYQKLQMSNPQKLAVFLFDHKSAIIAIPGGILNRDEKASLFPKNPAEFNGKEIRVSTLAVIVRYFLPINGGPPDPTNSIWKTRLKLLGDTSALHYFIRLWRLWNKYQHNEQMNQSKEEFYIDFEFIKTGIPAMIPHTAQPIVAKIDRFDRLSNCCDNEKNSGVLRNVLKIFDVISTDLHRDDSHLQHLLCKDKGVDRMLIAAINLPHSS